MVGPLYNRQISECGHGLAAHIHPHWENAIYNNNSWSWELSNYSLGNSADKEVFKNTKIHLDKASSYLRNDNKINEFLLLEKRAELDTIKPFLNFQLQAQESKKELKEFISKTKNHGQSISALGASTKGNVILQYCDIDSSQIEEIGEVNSNKFGTVTPGSMIPINSEESVLSNEPDYLIILPWHFRDFFVKSSKFIGRNLVFPLSELEIVTPKN